MPEEKKKRPSQMNAIEFQEFLEMAPEHTEPSEDGLFHHVPIAYLEPDLRYTFESKIEILIIDIKEMFAGIVMHIRLRVFHPAEKIWLEFDGVAAVSIEGVQPGQFKGTTKTMVLEELKMGVPSCYSVAIQNAAKKIGKRFGSDLNRVNKPDKQPKDKTEVKKKAVDDRVSALIEDCKSIAELNLLMPDLPNTPEVQDALNKKLTQLKKKK